MGEPKGEDGDFHQTPRTHEKTYVGFLELKNRTAGLENSVNGFSEGLETEREQLSEPEVRT